MSSYARLISHIKKYEDDIFSAANAGMTGAEPEKVADILIDNLIERHIDGLAVAVALDKVRQSRAK